eukprot:CAMPEP_0117432244 /NCGR_PEP_ID=MMETSP0758-20121206/11756_1 /TAXON_ID=63605 /ORGANISM="Percolomonas cosmopolitus, Strain AE-1 (ATCC 50343)" /LENGTH=314 /DNA_ID=CAMNT_0005222015 /DNA_START=41 /DNA_END=982 /DNA_ORIENTATION=-
MSQNTILNVGLCQFDVGHDKEKNVETASKAIEDAVKKGADLVVLPECFNSPYGTKYFGKYAESISDSPTLEKMSKLAKKHNITLVAGSIPTKEQEKLYNTSVVFNRAGERIAIHRKKHLFDIDIPGKITFRESDVLTGGNALTSFTVPIPNSTNSINVGLGICFDIRFPEMAQVLTRDDQISLMIYPGAFNMTTGPAHWQLLARGRAVDNQLYVALCSPARDEDAGYVAYGHSLMVDPYGEVLNEAEGAAKTMVIPMDLSRVNEVRAQIPVNSTKYGHYNTLPSPVPTRSQEQEEDTSSMLSYIGKAAKGAAIA